MTFKNITSKRSLNDIFVLKDCIGFFSTIMVVLTNNKKEMMKNIKNEFEKWMLNKEFDYLKSSLIDLSICVHLDQKGFNRYKRQDLDNISKIVLDSLSKDISDLSKPYLFENDSQIVRLLLCKYKRTEVKDTNTSLLTISFRVNMPLKQMILINPRVI